MLLTDRTLSYCWASIVAITLSCPIVFGLAITKRILNRHQGKLEFTSPPIVGSRFTVWLRNLAEGT